MSKKDREALSKKFKERRFKEQERADRRMYDVEHHPERYPNKYDELENFVKQVKE